MNIAQISFDNFQVFILGERLQRPSSVNKAVEHAHAKTAAQKLFGEHTPKETGPPNYQHSSCLFKRAGIDTGDSMQATDVLNGKHFTNFSPGAMTGRKRSAVQLHVGDHPVGLLPVIEKCLGGFICVF